MKPFFESHDRRVKLVHSALEWLGTPFAPHAAVKGAGVDCVWLAARIYIESGFLAEFNPPDYTMDGGAHNDLSPVLNWIERSGKFQQMEDGELQIGDLLCFRMGRSVHHVGVVMTATTFLHVYRGYPVMESRLDDPTWSKRLAAVFRPLAGEGREAREA